MRLERRGKHGVPARTLAAAAWLVLAGAGLAAQPAAAQPAAQAGETRAEAQEIVVHLGSFTNDLHAAFMALSLATNLQQSGASVTLFLDREGVRMADSRRGDLTWGDSGAIADDLAAFSAAGGAIVLCPHCAHLGGVDAASLRPGAHIATPEEVAGLFLSADKVIDF